MKIGELARRTGLSASRIRFYEASGLIEALRAAWEGADRPIVDVRGEPGPLPLAVETAAYRIAMEAIGNAVGIDPVALGIG